MDYTKLYVDFVKKLASLSRPVSIVCDASNGATGMILKELLPALRLTEYTIINSEPDAEFPAHGPNPLIPGALDDLSRTVVEKKAELGVAFDADGDRAFFVDENGVRLPSFIIAAMLFIHNQPPFVSDELVYQALYHMKIFPADILHASRVGVFFIKEKMRETQATTGAEFSGHFYFNDFFGADSGIVTMLRVMSILSQNSQTLSSFASSLPPHHVVNEDVSIQGKDWESIQKKITSAYEIQGAVIERREGITLQTKSGWVNIRPSNTEPILRLYAGAATQQESERLLRDIRALI